MENVEKENRELDLVDILAILWKKLIWLINYCWSLLKNIVSWIVPFIFKRTWLLLIFLAAGAAFGYYYHSKFVSYRSSFLLNIPSRPPYYGIEFAESANNYKDAKLAEYLSIDIEDAKQLKEVKAYYVVDVNMDGNIDFVDYDNSLAHDSILTRSNIRFMVETYTAKESCVPAIKDALVNKMCSDPAFKGPWEVTLQIYEDRIQFYKDELLSIDSLQQILVQNKGTTASIISKESGGILKEIYGENRVQLLSYEKIDLQTRLSYDTKHYTDELSLGPVSSTLPIQYQGKTKSILKCIIEMSLCGLIIYFILSLFIEYGKYIKAFIWKKE